MSDEGMMETKDAEIDISSTVAATDHTIKPRIDAELMNKTYIDIKKRLARVPLCVEFCQEIGIPRWKFDRSIGKGWWRNFLRGHGDTQYCSDSLSKKHFLDDYYALKSDLGKKPSYREFLKATCHGEASLCRYFGRPGWRSMLVAAGDPLPPPPTLDKSFYVDAYLKLKNELGKQPTRALFRTNCKISNNRIIKAFGVKAWLQLVTMAGDEKLPHGNCKVDGGHLIEDYKALKTQLGRRPRFLEYRKITGHSLELINRNFGNPGWFNLLKAVGDDFGKQREYNIDRGHLLEHYKKYVEECGQYPTVTDFTGATKHAAKTIEIHFGKPGWKNFVLAAGGEIIKRTYKGIDKAHLIADYREMASKSEKQLSLKAFSKATKHARGTVYKYFPGGWSALIAAANSEHGHETASPEPQNTKTTVENSD